MSLESEIVKADKEIVSKLNDASKAIVVQAYTPLFEKVKIIALAHMNQMGISEIGIEGLYFRTDGNFYSYSRYGEDGTRPIDLKSLPIFLDSKKRPQFKEGFTQYQSEMSLVLDEFRNAVKASLAQLV